LRIEIGENDAGRRLDRFLKRYLRSAPLSLIYRLIRKDVKVNGRRADAETLLETGDVVELFLSGERLRELAPARAGAKSRRQFGIVYEDAQILAVNKPYGLLTHGDGLEQKNTLANQILAYFVENGVYNPHRDFSFSPAPANRLDRNTTGLIVFGKTLPALQALTAMFRSGHENPCVEKAYLSIVSGELAAPLRLRGKMSRDERTNTTVVREVGSPEGLLMATDIRPLATNGGYTLVEAILLTGRTHQIRAQLAAAGYPVIGDRKYGSPAINREFTKRFALDSQLLHAYRLTIRRGLGILEPLTGRVLEAPVPPRFSEIAATLGLETPRAVATTTGRPARRGKSKTGQEHYAKQTGHLR